MSLKIDNFFKIDRMIGHGPGPAWMGDALRWNVYRAPNLTTTMGYCRYSPVITSGLHSAVLDKANLAEELENVFFHELEM